ncbi:Uncharacterised protein [Halioglobus japonicus]|nr:Uncharacterised protein [Halioglobus japonicus]
MRNVILLLCAFALPSAGAAAACDLENKREIQVGASTGVAGECSNTGATVRCISDGENTQRLNCDGPEGTFSGPNLQTLIATACGCSASSEDDNEVAEQLQQAVDD